MLITNVEMKVGVCRYLAGLLCLLINIGFLNNFEVSRSDFLGHKKSTYK